MMRDQRYAIRKRVVLEKAVMQMRVAFDDLKRVRPDVNAYMGLIDRSSWGNRDAARQVRAIERAERRYEKQRQRVMTLVREFENRY